MAIVRWEPAGDLGSLQREIDRVLSSFLGGEAVRRPSRGWTPAIDLQEHEDGFVLTADLPGVSADDVAIDVERNVLTLSGARSRSDAGGTIVSERGYGSFRRRLTLPEGVDPDEIVASFDRGVLEVRIPKPAQARPRRVSIDVGGGDRPTMIEGTAGDAGTRETTERADAAA
ncbi:unannotated protein [freshwater metagenome]|uniref:Unannotated protein n=1 Tax=freshwater metagenome TaxID=449393 RepID=A0A6J7J522_9ZZZZ|nr:Hsp20 family protein [Actinomycetota bacterium]